MADMTAGPNGAATGTRGAGFVNLVGAVVSVGLVIGVGVWGYKLLVRDVSGVPVVRAMQGEMRVAPENPGGEIALYTGLAVNTVPAEGGAAEPEDRLVLAPAQPEIPQEDLDVAPVAEATEVAAAPATQAPVLEAETQAALQNDPADPVVDPLAGNSAAVVDPNQPMTADDILALADQIAAGAAPLSDLADGDDAPVQVAVNGVAMTGLIDASIPGVSRSLRPTARPAGRPQAVEATPVAAEATSAPAATGAAPQLTAALPAGTKLVQLGAFDSPEIAAQEWVRLSGRFDDYMAGKERVIQEAQSGGRTFYRLRALGFADLGDARRFCSALVAQNAECIPVVVR